MDTLPGAGQPVRLRDVTRSEYSSVVTGVEDGLVAFARPADFPGPAEFGVGYRLEMEWPGERSLLLVALQVVDVRITDDGVVWLGRAVQPVRREQRREYVRVPMGGPMTLQQDGATHHATLVDVSEAALRARFKATVELAVGAELRAAFTVNDLVFLVDAALYRVEESVEGHRDAIVVFSLDERAAAELRRAVFGEQIRQRRLLPDDAGLRPGDGR